MPRAWVEVDLDALVENAATLQRRAGVPLLPMVKADAYGLGAARVVAALGAVSPWGFGVATHEEGAALRLLGCLLPIVVFTPPLPGELGELRRCSLTPALAGREVINEWIHAAGGPWQLAIDTGMNRAGVRWSSVAELHDLLRISPPEGAFTHLHSAESDADSVAEQEERFRSTIAFLPQRPALLHTENSAAIVRRNRSEWDLVRPGIFMYGVSSGAPVSPRHVVSLRARVVAIHELEPGECVSYGATYRVERRSRIATAALGYADGLRRAFSNRGRGILNGKEVPIRGLVTMDMTMFDVTDVACSVGDVVTLVGSDGGSHISINEAAATAGISPYELLASLGNRLPRRYVGVSV
jgi:alanine racemase